MGCIMPWERTDSASSFNAASSIWVRGWYLPARIWFSGTLEGNAGSFFSSRDKSSMTLISLPNSADKPRPRPLAFFTAAGAVLAAVFAADFAGVLVVLLAAVFPAVFDDAVAMISS